MSPEAHPAYVAPDPLLCRIYTGTYVGDGTLAQAIVGVGFRPKFVFIAVNRASEGEIETFIRSDTMEAGNAIFHDFNSVTVLGDRITSLDADGFTVDDDGADENPNKDTTNYWFICLG